MEISLIDAYVDHLKIGQYEGENLNMDLFVFSHPYYVLLHSDDHIGHLYEDYRYAFVVFEIINN